MKKIKPSGPPLQLRHFLNLQIIAPSTFMVKDDFTKELNEIYCGTNVTNFGEIRYKEVLDTNVHVNFEEGILTLLFSSHPKPRQTLVKAKEMFSYMSGSCSSAMFKRYFVAI